VRVDGSPHHLGLFDLVRRLKLIVPDADPAILAQCVALWAPIAREHGTPVPGFNRLWTEFISKWNMPMRDPPGEALARVKSRIPAVEVPSELSGTPLEPVGRVMIAFAEEAVGRGKDEFYAAIRLIADLAGVGKDTILKRLKTLWQMGYLSMVMPGTRGSRPGARANVYTWHKQPIPGKAVWRRSHPKNVAIASPEEADEFAGVRAERKVENLTSRDTCTGASIPVE
jgi:hypothetical protein